MNDTEAICATCGNGIDQIRGRWTHVTFLPHGEEHHVWCHMTKAFPNEVSA